MLDQFLKWIVNNLDEYFFNSDQLYVLIVNYDCRYNNNYLGVLNTVDSDLILF